MLRLRGGNEENVTLTVSLMSGKNITVDTNAAETISKIKLKIEEKENIPHRNIRYY